MKIDALPKLRMMPNQWHVALIAVNSKIRNKLLFDFANNFVLHSRLQLQIDKILIGIIRRIWNKI